MVKKLKKIIILMAIFYNSLLFAQLDVILSIFPEAKDFNEIPYKERSGWGFTTEKDGTKLYMLYNSNYTKGEIKNDKYLFGMTVLPDKSFLVAKYEYGKSHEGALISADGQNAITGDFYNQLKKPKFQENSCINSGKDGSFRYSPAKESYCIHLMIDKNQIVITKKDLNKKMNNVAKINEQGLWLPNSQNVFVISYNFEGKNIKTPEKVVYTKSSDSKFIGTATSQEQCITFVYKNASTSITGNTSIDYFYAFVTVNEAYGKEKSKIVAAAREYVKKELSIPYKYTEFEVNFNGTECSEVKSKVFGSNSSTNFIINWMNYSKYSPDR